MSHMKLKKTTKKKKIKYIFLIIFIYSIIPNLPLSGFLLDSSQKMYVNKKLNLKIKK